jgi:hypothetical protein
MRNKTILLIILLSFASQVRSQNFEPRLFYNLHKDTTDSNNWYDLNLVLLYKNQIFFFSLVNSENSCGCYYTESKSAKNNIIYALKMVKKMRLDIGPTNYFTKEIRYNSTQINTSTDPNLKDTTLTGRMFLTETNLVILETVQYMGQNKSIYADKDGVFDAVVYKEFSRRKTKRWFKKFKKSL